LAGGSPKDSVSNDDEALPLLEAQSGYTYGRVLFFSDFFKFGHHFCSTVQRLSSNSSSARFWP
jgi:hypothetical protein